jgi:hypothetical protein
MYINTIIYFLPPLSITRNPIGYRNLFYVIRKEFINKYFRLPDYFFPRHSTRINLRAMLLKGPAGRICHLENVKSYMSYLQQYTKIIKKTYRENLF